MTDMASTSPEPEQSAEKGAVEASEPQPAPDLPVYHPERPRLRKRPLKALHHFRNLVRDKENTEEVFYIFKSLPSQRQWRQLESFVTSERGQKLRAAEPFLPPILDDHDTLRSIGPGTVAEAYVEFMESQGLTAAGLVEEYQKFTTKEDSYEDLTEWYIERNRDTHDLVHVLTGYNRDALGEQCVLAFTHGQQHGLGYLFIAYAGALHMHGHGGEGAPILSAVREAQKMGRGTRSIAETPTMELLAMPLDEARSMLGITEPKVYQRCHEYWRKRGIDPFDVMAPPDAKNKQIEQAA